MTREKKRGLYGSFAADHGPRSAAQGLEHAVDFFFGVVVNEADAEKAAIPLDVEPLGEVERIVVAIPGENAAIAKSPR